MATVMTGVVPVSPDVWIPALSGAVGALLGAGASVLGLFISARQQEREHERERQEAVEDQERQRRDQIFTQAAAIMADAFSLLHETNSLASEGPAQSSDSVAKVGERWTKLRDQLLIVGSTYPRREEAERTIKLVGRLTRVFNWLESSRGSAGPAPSPVNDAIEEVAELLDRFRANEKLPPIFPQPTVERQP